MTNTKRKVEVSLLGQCFAVRTDRDDEYVASLARHVGKQLDDVRKQTRSVSTHHLALLVSLNLADQLFQKEEELLKLKQAMRTKTTDILHNVKTALSHLPEPSQTAAQEPEQL